VEAAERCNEALWNVKVGKRTVAEVIVRSSHLRLNAHASGKGLALPAVPAKSELRKSSRWELGIDLKKDDVVLGRQMLQQAVAEGAGAASTKSEPACKAARKSSRNRARARRTSSRAGGSGLRR